MLSRKPSLVEETRSCPANSILSSKPDPVDYARCQISARMMFLESVVIWREVVIQLCTLYLHSYVQQQRNANQKIVASVLSTDHRHLCLATNVCPRARAQHDGSTCWMSGHRRQTSARQAPASRVSHVTADWLFMSVQHRFQTVSRSQIQRKMPAMSNNLTLSSIVSELYYA